MNKLPMTTVGYSVLENELKHRIQIDRPRLIERIQGAIADDSNLAENAEYQAAKSEQEINEARIAELEDSSRMPTSSTCPSFQAIRLNSAPPCR
jgi:transcription elongation factor GreA